MPDFLKFPDLDQLGNAEKANRLEIFLDSTKNVKFDQFMIDLLNEALWSSREKSSAKYKDLILDLSSYISHANGIEPSYHNQNHFKDVCLSMTLLLRAQTEIVPLLAQSSHGNSPIKRRGSCCYALYVMTLVMMEVWISTPLILKKNLLN